MDVTAFFTSVPFWAIGILIFSLRIVDVSVGTIRTIVMVQGRLRLAITLGFFEVLVWVIAVAQVVTRIDEAPWLAPFYAGGFATGVGVGMLIERRLALGRYVIRIISHSRAREVAEAVQAQGRVLGIFRGETLTGPANLVFVSARGQQVRGILEAARSVDPEMFYLVESARAWSENAYPVPHPTGWRAIFKKK